MYGVSELSRGAYLTPLGVLCTPASVSFPHIATALVMSQSNLRQRIIGSSVDITSGDSVLPCSDSVPFTTGQAVFIQPKDRVNAVCATLFRICALLSALPSARSRGNPTPCKF